MNIVDIVYNALATAALAEGWERSYTAPVSFYLHPYAEYYGKVLEEFHKTSKEKKFWDK